MKYPALNTPYPMFRKTTVNPETNTPVASDPNFIYLTKEPDGQYAEWVLTPNGSWEKIGHLAPEDISPEELVDYLVNYGRPPLPPLSQNNVLYFNARTEAVWNPDDPKIFPYMWRSFAYIQLMDGTSIPFQVPLFKNPDEICNRPFRFQYNDRDYTISIARNEDTSHDARFVATISGGNSSMTAYGHMQSYYPHAGSTDRFLEWAKLYRPDEYNRLVGEFNNYCNTPSPKM